MLPVLGEMAEIVRGKVRADAATALVSTNPKDWMCTMGRWVPATMRGVVSALVGRVQVSAATLLASLQVHSLSPKRMESVGRVMMAAGSEMLRVRTFAASEKPLSTGVLAELVVYGFAVLLLLGVGWE